jgi:hypothetical protein
MGGCVVMGNGLNVYWEGVHRSGKRKGRGVVLRRQGGEEAHVKLAD